MDYLLATGSPAFLFPATGHDLGNPEGYQFLKEYL